MKKKMRRKYSADLYEKTKEGCTPILKIIAIDDTNRIKLVKGYSLEKKTCGNSGLCALFDEIRGEITENPIKNYRLEIEVEEERDEK